MRRSRRDGVVVCPTEKRSFPGAVFSLLGVLALVAAVVGCDRETGEDAAKSSATVRAARRLYDGAPPVIPHENFGMICTECHNELGVEVDDVGFAPPSPHDTFEEVSSIGRCRQCHVFRQTEAVLVANRFVGLRQDLRRGMRLNLLAPPTIPHKTFMRENCTACHSGTAAREEILTPHPERTRCRQCHVPSTSRREFSTQFGPGF